MKTMDVTFGVEVETSFRETVCLCGSVEQLGRWDANRIVVMKRQEPSDIWTCAVPLEHGERVQYRYLVCMFDETPPLDTSYFLTDSLIKYGIQRWETHLKPRSLVVGDPPKSGVDEFGVIDGVRCVDRGWLTHQTEILIKLHNHPITLMKRSLHDRTITVKCRLVDLSAAEASSDDDESLHYDCRTSNHHFPVYVSSLSSVELSRPHEQPEYGEICRPEDFLIFRAQTFRPESTGLILDIYLASKSTCDIPQYLGNAYFLPQSSTSGSSGSKVVPITGIKQNPVGQMVIEYVYIRPMVDNSCDLSISFAKYWNTQREPLDIGHRGMGSTKPREAAIPENTISSFNAAGHYGADYVEFDVQLCKDLTVVVYHDFKVCLTMKQKSGAGRGSEFHESPVKDLTLNQLQRLRLDHAAVLGDQSGVCPNDDYDPDHPEDWQLFPTLQQVFERVDPLVGFDIEIKYPMALADGKHEMEHFFDQNLYVDTILNTILKHAGERRVILTCFDPDICSMIRSKQCLYPVVFSCMGETSRWTWYGDVRTHTYHMSLCHTLSDEMTGVSAYYDELIKNMELFRRIKDEGLLLFVWGTLTDKETIKQVKGMGVDGLIYDKINQLKGTPSTFRLEAMARANGGPTSP